MVNTGKPSTGCATCKKRKIKCDERRPHCLRCEKIGKDCPGVPAPLDFVFRPGKGVAPRFACSKQRLLSAHRKLTNSLWSSSGEPLARSVSSKGKSRNGREHALSHDSMMDPAELGQSTPLSRQPSLSLENQGVAIFFKDFVMAPQNGVLGNFLSCLPSVYGNASSTSPLRYAVAANAISSLRSYLSRPSLWNAALWYYGQALEAMREAMGNGQRVQSDDVLLTVMLLKLFENQVGSSKNLVGYEYHTTAAAALLVKRGSSQFRNASSLRLFRTIRWHVFMVSVQSSRFPNTLYSGFDWFADRDIPDENADCSRLAAAAFELPLLRGQASAILSQPDHLRVQSEVHDLLMRATRIDEELANWHAALGDQWHPALHMQHDASITDSWHGTVHGFESRMTALHLNTYRLLRILANGIALRCAAVLNLAGDTSMELPSKQATFVLQRMVDDICASVPWYLNYWPDNSPKDATLDGGAGLGVAGAYFLIWPLFVAMSVHCVPIEQRHWCCGKLREIGSDYGFRQAGPLADAFSH